MKYGTGDVWAEADKEVYIFRVSALIYKLNGEDSDLWGGWATQWKEPGSLNIDVEGGWPCYSNIRLCHRDGQLYCVKPLRLGGWDVIAASITWTKIGGITLASSVLYFSSTLFFWGTNKGSKISTAMSPSTIENILSAGDGVSKSLGWILSPYVIFVSPGSLCPLANICNLVLSHLTTIHSS